MNVDKMCGLYNKYFVENVLFMTFEPYFDHESPKQVARHVVDKNGE